MAIILPFPYDCTVTRQDNNLPKQPGSMFSHCALLTIREADRRVAIGVIIRTALKRLHGSTWLAHAKYRNIVWEQYGVKSPSELSTEQMSDLLRHILNRDSSRHWRNGKRQPLSPEDRNALLSKVTALLTEQGVRENGQRESGEYC